MKRLKKALEKYKVLKVVTHHLYEDNPKLCIIIGPNASGKSLIRKVMTAEYHYSKKFLLHLSQEARTTSGIPRAFIYGTEEYDSTGYNSIRTFITAIENIKVKTEPTGLFIDEPEIGCSEDVQLSLGEHLAKEFDSMTSLDCCYVVTHSKAFVEPLMSLNPSCLSLVENLTLESWLDKKPTSVDLQQVIKNGQDMWRKIEKIIEEGKKK